MKFSPITKAEYKRAEGNGVSNQLLSKRIWYLAWEREKAIMEPPRPYESRKEWSTIAEGNGISYQAFMTRLANGWDEHRAATEPVETPEQRRARVTKQFQARRKYPIELIQQANANGVSTKLFHHRCRRMSPEEAAAMPYGGPKTKEG